MRTSVGDSTVIDFAGGTVGGAGRFRGQYLALEEQGKLPPNVPIGFDEYVTPSWLLRRELVARGAGKVVAANNVGTVTAGKERWTLLRNANHFLSDEEWAASRQHFSPKFRSQIPIVRAALHRSDLLVVPSQSMAERVLRVHPKLHDRVVVRFHPLLQPPRRRPTGEGRKVILCPVVPSPYKDLDTHLTAIARALSGREDIEVVMTMSPADAPPKLRERKLFRFCGVLPREELEEIYSTCAAVYYPTLVESFGYPLAEARAAGIPVIAQDIAHNRDIAGGALFGFQYADDESLADAVDRALDTDLIADPAPFDPESYFKWLLD